MKLKFKGRWTALFLFTVLVAFSIDSAHASNSCAQTLSIDAQIIAKDSPYRVGSWLEKPLTAHPKTSDIIFQRNTTVSGCIANMPVKLGQTSVVSYSGDVNTLQLSLTDADWRDIVPEGVYKLDGRLNRIQWRYIGLPVEFLKVGELGALTVTPNLVALKSYTGRTFSGTLERDPNAMRLNGTYRRTSLGSLGFAMAPTATETMPGYSLDAAWAYQLTPTTHMNLGIDNMISRVRVDGIWRATSVYELERNNALAFNASDNNDINGTYGQFDGTLSLPRKLWLSVELQHWLVNQIEFLYQSNQGQLQLTKRWHREFGSLSAALVNTSGIEIALNKSIKASVGASFGIAVTINKWGGLPITRLSATIVF
jgi:hypothetical protein